MASNSGGYSDRLNVVITVTDVNEGPEISRVGSSPGSVPENHDRNQVLARYTATDPEGGTVSRWRTSGTDGGDFVINEQGELRFRNTPDYERPADSNGDNVYVFTVQASDGRNYGSFDETVTVTPLNEPPAITTTSSSATMLRQNENVTSRLYTYRATDPEGAEVAWSVSGADAGDFKIGRETGVLTFREPPNFDIPGGSGTHSNEYQVTVVASDGLKEETLAVTVTVTDVNEGPVIADTGANTTITVDENHDQVLDTYTATDPESQAVTRWSVTGRDGGDFTINDGGELTFRNPPDHERPADSGRDNVYEVTVRASDGRYYGTLDVVVTVEAVDEAPEFQRNTQDSFVYPENGSSAIYTYRATDPEGSDVTWGLSGTDRGAFSIDKTGVLTFNSPPDYEDPADTDHNNVYELTVEASDGFLEQPNNTPLEVTVTVTNLTDARAVIRGTAQVGRTLTAETSGIPDKDRRDKVDFSYQWLGDDTDVEGATDQTYEITERDEGKTIKVRVKFTGNAGEEETLTSAATAPVKPAQSNEPAAGLPTINGTAQVGETLTADASGISDADGMTNAVFRYQWTRWDGDTDEDIEGATGSTYEVSGEDEGKTIRLRVGFSDDRGNDEALISAATGAVAARPAQLTATFPASQFQSSRHQGEDDRPQVIVAFNLPVQSFDKTTPSVSLTGATVSSLVRHEEDRLENAWVFFLDPEGNDDIVFTLVAGQPCDVGGICTGEGKMLSEGGTATLPGPDEEDKPDNTGSNEPNSPATGEPTISGTAQVGETLTANTSGAADADGLEDVSFTYQWLADDADIAGATNATYTLLATDESKAIRVRVSFTDDAGNDETLTSPATDAVAAEPLEPPAKPTGLTGTASHDSVTLTWDDPQDESITGYAILRRIPGVDPDGQFRELVADTGTTATTYTDDAVKSEARYTYRIKAINGAGTSERSRWFHIDTPASPAPEPANTPATGAPTISGTTQVGGTLTVDTSGIADADGLSDVQYEHQWLADDADIAGATGSTYTLADIDEGKAIKVEVSFTDDAGNEETLTSRATAAVVVRPNSPATGEPTISGTAQVGETLTADTPGISDADGLGNVQYEYLWLANDSDISGATSATYTLAAADEGKAIKVRVSFTDDAGNEETVTSAATDAVAAAPQTNTPATGAPTISGTAQVGETLTANTSGISDADGLGNAQYEYQWLADDADIAGATGLTYTLTDSEESKAIKVQVSFTDDADNEETLTSGATDAVVVRPNSPATGEPTISGTAQVGETLEADTSGIADADGLGNVQYEYQWLLDDSAISGATNSTYTLVAADEGKAITVQVTFTDDAGNGETLTSAATDAGGGSTHAQ